MTALPGRREVIGWFGETRANGWHRFRRRESGLAVSECGSWSMPDGRLVGWPAGPVVCPACRLDGQYGLAGLPACFWRPLSNSTGGRTRLHLVLVDRDQSTDGVTYSACGEHLLTQGEALAAHPLPVLCRSCIRVGVDSLGLDIDDIKGWPAA